MTVKTLRSSVASFYTDFPFTRSDYWYYDFPRVLGSCSRGRKVFSNRSVRTRVAACWDDEDEVWKCNNLRVSGPRGPGCSESDNSWLTDSAMSDSWSRLSLLWTADCSNFVTLRSWSRSPLLFTQRYVITSSPLPASCSAAGVYVVSEFAHYGCICILLELASLEEYYDTETTS